MLSEPPLLPPYSCIVIVPSLFNSPFSSSRGSAHGCTLSTTTWCLCLVSAGLITASCFTGHCHNLLLLCPVLSGCPWGQHSHPISAALKYLVSFICRQKSLCKKPCSAVTHEWRTWLFTACSSLTDLFKLQPLAGAKAKCSLFRVTAETLFVVRKLQSSYHLKPNFISWL